MRFSSKNFEKLVERYKEISLLGKVAGVLSWDLNVNLPPAASQGRADQIAYTTRLVTEKWLDKDFRELFEKAKKERNKLNQEEKAALRNLEWAAKYYFRVPKEIIIEFAETTTKAFVAWRRAREQDRFADFLPHLKKLLRLNQVIAEHLGYKENPYDALLDLYEPGLTAAFCQKIFAQLRPDLTATIKKAQKSSEYREKVDLVGGEIAYPADDQRQIALFVMRRMGYDFDAGRLDDITGHPFTSTLDRQDVRITNRYKPNDFRESLTIAMHETGHALYEQGVNEEYSQTPLEGGVSLGIHESQSRFWENQVGRSAQFLGYLTPVLHAFFPEQLSKTGPEVIFSLFNRVKPGFIRVEADEVTYNLHIILRFEVEKAMVNGKVKPDDLPEIWRGRMKKYLGVVPETDKEGVLQDVHWTHGPMGYFPTYTLGNLYAAQFTAKMAQELDLKDLMERGELGTILSWLRQNIHQHGSLYWPDELSQKVTGEKLNPSYFLNYLKEKYSQI